jgi:hypothetical protein
MKQAEKLCDSQAFRILAERHRGTDLSIVAIEAGRGDLPDRAWVQCSRCGETFRFRSDGGWELMEDMPPGRFGHAVEIKASVTA